MNRINLISNDFDYIDDMPVQLFFSAEYLYDEGLKKIGGNNRVYQKGEKLEINSLYYKYADNFAIIDTNKTDNLYGVIVKNKIVIGYQKITPNDISSLEKFYAPNGIEIKADFYEELIEFVNNHNLLRSMRIDISNKYNNLLMEIQSLIDEDELLFIKRKPELDALVNESINLVKQFHDEWYITGNEDEQIFGMYLSLLIEYMKKYILLQEMFNKLNNKETITTEEQTEMIKLKDEKIERDFTSLKEEFSYYLSNHKELKKNYLLWLNLKGTDFKEDEIDMIKNIILNIDKHLED